MYCLFAGTLDQSVIADIIISYSAAYCVLPIRRASTKQFRAESMVFKTEDSQYAPPGDPAAHLGGLERQVSSLELKVVFRAEDPQYAPLGTPAEHFGVYIVK